MSAVVDVIGSYAGWLVTRAGGLLAVIGVGKLLLDWWRRGPGRRRRWVRLFNQLALGVRHAYVVSLFGEPAYQREFEGRRLDTNSEEQPSEEPATFTERVWQLAEDGYLQLLTDDQDNVVRYSLTSRSTRFRPRIALGGVSLNFHEFTVNLGVTRFSDIPWPCRRVYIGPSGATAPYEYRQAYNFGRSGGYADWICTYNAAGSGMCVPISPKSNPPPWNQPVMIVDEWYQKLATQEREDLDSSRAGTTINTVTIEHFLSDLSDSCRYGPDRERIRLMSERKHWYAWNWRAKSPPGRPG